MTTPPFRPIRLTDFLRSLASIVEKQPQVASSYLVVSTAEGMKPVLSFDLKGLVHTQHPDEGPDHPGNDEDVYMLEITFRPDVDVDDPTAMAIDELLTEPKKGPIH